ncbi:MAG: hypothetical protein ACREUU_15145 [Gammaproteobacteria bacterium]
MYRCEAASVAGFIQQLAVAYVAHGYWFYVTGKVPAHKAPRAVDTKLIARYALDMSKWTRCRRRKNGTASVQYLRHGRFFILVATHGRHEFFTAEASRILDIRRVPLRYASYAVSCRLFLDKWHATVRLDAGVFRNMKAQFTSLALHADTEQLTQAFRRLPVEPDAAVRRQLFELLHAVNRARHSAGLQPIPTTALRLHRRSVTATSCSADVND